MAVDDDDDDDDDADGGGDDEWEEDGCNNFNGNDDDDDNEEIDEQGLDLDLKNNVFEKWVGIPRRVAARSTAEEESIISMVCLQ